MKLRICELLGIEFPLFAFRHCRDVVAAVSRAGGFGVLGATRHSPESIEIELKWIDDHVNGKPYGLDGSLARANRQTIAAAALRLDRRVGAARQSQPLANAVTVFDQ
jgi:hypothetical protein